jgi:succinate dehydrogenase/fumarate reductase flavoprotein subunit
VWWQLRNAKGSMRTAEVRLKLQKTMQRDAAVFRTQSSLENGVKMVDEHYKEFQDVKISDRSLIWNTDLLETLELQNIMDNALITMYAPTPSYVTDVLPPTRAMSCVP